jgi:nucleoside-diphosphate-sugar epimerase
MWDFYNDKNILVTGGSGFLGTAVVHRILTSSERAHIYLICRGGME